MIYDSDISYIRPKNNCYFKIYYLLKCVVNLRMKNKANQMVKRVIEKFITKNTDVIFFILPLSLFALIGFAGLYFAIKYPTNVPFYGWFIILTFILMPLLLIYGFVFGFSISEKRQKEIEDRRNSVSFNDNGISIEMKLFDKTCFVNWKSVDVVTYYNFSVSSDFTDHYEGYKLYLNEIPLYTKYEKQWWLNKLFPKDSKSKIVAIKNDTKYFSQIPEAIQKYLTSETVTQKHKPTTPENERIIYNKRNLKNDEIKHYYR